MPTSVGFHPSTDQLRDFVLGRLPTADSLRVEDHVDQCMDCCTRLGSCNADADPLVVWLKQANPTTPPVGDGGNMATMDFTNTHDYSFETDAIPGFLGRYEILSELGRGGMGVVYKARDTKLKRLVAIKMMSNGNFSTAENLARFHQEGLAVARLRHPHIVQLHEVGDENGNPYLVLEYLDGGSLADMKGAMKPADAAALVQKLAEAVEHAHVEGVIHRDLKPANVLLSRDGVAKITDFGLVKFDPSTVNSSQPLAQTTAGYIVGTPRYMSPEQASGKPGVIGPASDIYSLGAILYELLTDVPPFAELMNPLEIVQALQEREPTSPRRYCPDMPRDLEVICQKCLRLEPYKRYTTAKELADELGRFLRGEPILARPLSWRQRAGRWCRRNPVVAGLLSGLAAVIVASLIGLTWLYLDADAQRQRAEQKEREAIGFAQEADRQRQEAVAYFHVAQEAVETFQARVIEDPKLQLFDFRPLRTVLLESTLRFHEALTRRHTEDPQLQLVQGRAFLQLGKLRQELGDSNAALAAYEKAAQILLRLAAKESVQRHARQALAQARQARAMLLVKLGRTTEGVAEYRDALAVQEQLAQEVPNDQEARYELLVLRGNFANALDQAGRPAEALQLMRADAPRWEELASRAPTVNHRACLANMCHNLGMKLQHQGQKEAGLFYHKRAYELCSQMGKELPKDTLRASALGDACLGLSSVYFEMNRLEEARTVMQEGHQLYEKLVNDHPNMLEYRIKLGGAACNMGLVLAKMLQPREALPFFDQAVRELEAVQARDARLTTGRGFLVIARVNRALLLEWLGRHADALADREAALKLAPSVGLQLERAHSLIHVGRVPEGITVMEQAVALEPTPSHRFSAAALYSLAAEKSFVQSVLAEGYLKESFLLLQALAKEGYLQDRDVIQSLRTHPDFAALRRHATFKSLPLRENKQAPEHPGG